MGCGIGARFELWLLSDRISGRLPRTRIGAIEVRAEPAHAALVRDALDLLDEYAPGVRRRAERETERIISTPTDTYCRPQARTIFVNFDHAGDRFLLALVLVHQSAFLALERRRRRRAIVLARRERRMRLGNAATRASRRFLRWGVAGSVVSKERGDQLGRWLDGLDARRERWLLRDVPGVLAATVRRLPR